MSERVKDNQIHIRASLLKSNKTLLITFDEKRTLIKSYILCRVPKNREIQNLLNVDKTKIHIH